MALQPRPARTIQAFGAACLPTCSTLAVSTGSADAMSITKQMRDPAGFAAGIHRRDVQIGTRNAELRALEVAGQTEFPDCSSAAWITSKECSRLRYVASEATAACLLLAREVELRDRQNFVDVAPRSVGEGSRLPVCVDRRIRRPRIRRPTSARQPPLTEQSRNRRRPTAAVDFHPLRESALDGRRRCS